MMEEEKKPDPGSEIYSEDVVDEPQRAYSVSLGVQTVISIAILMATLLTLWNPRKLIRRPDLTALLNMQIDESEETLGGSADTASNIAILSGHYLHDSGEVCADGLVEAEVNQLIASLVVSALQDKGFTVDLFPEFDLDLLQYQGKALVAIYSGSCTETPLPKSGFLIGTSLTAQNPDQVNILATCLGESYQSRTRLPFSYEVINPDHFSYHIFSDIHSDTPAVLIEIGSLKADREVILGSTSAVVEGIADGIKCFIKQTGGNEP
jgi:hypothetical protein